MKYRVKSGDRQIEVTIATSSPNERALIQYSPDDAEFRDWLESERGAFGHIIGDTTSAIDLHYVMNTDAAKQYKPELIEGDVDSYDPEIPDGSMT